MLGTGFWGCAPPFDTVRPPAPAHSVGHHIFAEVCNRVARSAYPNDVSGQRTAALCNGLSRPAVGAPKRLRALHGERQRLIDAIDQTLAANPDFPLHGDMQDYLQALMPLFDNGLAQRQVQAIASLLHSLLHTPGSVAALERLGLRQGYDPQPDDHSAGLRQLQLLPAVFGSPHLGAALTAVAAALTEDPPTRAAFAQLQAVMHQQLVTDPSHLLLADGTSLAPLREFLLRPAAAADSPAPTAEPLCVVARDRRGVARLAPQRGATTWVDRDGDGLADINASGEFIDPHGGVLQLPTPFGRPHAPQRDAKGRARDAQGKLVFAYRDVRHSHLAAVLDVTRVLMRSAPDSLPAMAEALDRMLGPHTTTLLWDPVLAQQVAAEQHDTAAAPLAETLLLLAHALVDSQPASAQGDGLGDLLTVAHGLMQAHEGVLARLVEALDPPGVAAAPPAQADALQLPAADALLGIGTDLAATPQLLEDVMAALQTPELSQLGATLAALLRHKDRIDFDLSNLNGPPPASLHTPVDRQAPAVGSNQSAAQRLLHLMHDSQQPLCNPPFAFDEKTYDRCEFFRIDNAAAFYLQAIAGQAHLTLRFSEDDAPMRAMLDELKGNGSSLVIGFDHAMPVADAERTAADHAACNGRPDSQETYDCATFSLSPQAAARMLFAVNDPRLDDSALGGTIALLRQITEPMQVPGSDLIARHGATLFALEKGDFFAQVRPLVLAFARHGQLDLLLRLSDVAHQHWGPGPGSLQLHSQELRLAQQLDAGQLLQASAQLSQAVGSLSVRGRSGTAVLLGSLRALLAPLSSLPEQPFVQLQPRTPLATQADHAPPRLAHALLRATRLLSDDMRGLALLPTAQAPVWQRQMTPDGLRFAQRPAYALLRDALPELRQQWLHGQTRGTGSAAQRMWDEMRGWGNDPVAAQLLALAQALGAHPPARTALTALLADVLDHNGDAVLTACAAGLQLLGDSDDMLPLLRALAPLFAPGSGILAVGAQLVAQASAQDAHHVLPRLLAGLHSDLVSQQRVETPLQALLDIYAQVNRVNPGHPTPLRMADYHRVLPELKSFMVDDKHGFARLVHLVEGRRSGVSSAPSR